MSLPILLFAAAAGGACLVVWLIIMRAHRRSLQSYNRSSPYHCVAIAFPECACDAVKKIRTYRFLSHEAPLLPLKKCTSSDCQCRYAHFPDRREDLRRNPYGIRRSVPPVAITRDRRAKADRRDRIAPR